MLYVDNDGTVRLTRGDTARLQVPITNTLTGTEYDMFPGDILRFTVKRTVNDTTPLIQKESLGINSFHIEPTDTKALAFGKYVYDVELTTASGDVYTVVAPSTFEVLREVT